MEESPAVQLIAVEIQNGEFAALLNDIRDFDWKTVNRLRKEDLERIKTTGFCFKSRGLENQKQEFKSFLFEHPSCMASDLEMIIFKLNIFKRLYTQGQESTVRVEEAQQPIKHQKTTKKSKKPKKQVIVIEEESSDEQAQEEEEEEDVEYVPVPYKRKR